MPTFCDGLTRRDALRIGTASLFGSAIGLPQLLRATETSLRRGGLAPQHYVSGILGRERSVLSRFITLLESRLKDDRSLAHIWFCRCCRP